jgi:signal transduction histidine kinase/CheY-like chemotaxis protein
MMRSRLRQLGALPAVVLVASIALAFVISFVIKGVVQDQERRLVRDRGGEVGATVQAGVSNIESSLPVLARIARLDRSTTKAEFADAARPLLAGGVMNVGAVEDRSGALMVAAAVGKGPVRGEQLQGPRAALVRRAFASKKLVTGLITDGGGTRISLAMRGRLFVAYQESAADPTQPIPSTPGSPYNGLNIALYASPREDPSKLVLTSTGRPLTGGTIDRRVLPVGADKWLLLTSSRQPLVGGFADDLPWLFLAAGIFTSLLFTTLVTVLVRRRAYAISAVEVRTAELRVALEERSRLEAAEREARAIAEDANQAKSEFLSRMSHELRTPLNAILGFGQLLELDGLSPDHQDSVDHILKGGRHLLGLVDEILDISRIEAGTMTISVEPVEVASAVGDVLRLVAPLAKESGIELESELPPADEAYVLADRLRLRQVLLNVLSNAVKYNRQGGWVRVSVQPRDGQRLEIRVADSGNGIPADKIDRLFTPFERLGAELGGTEGTGLGLALSKGLMERMGGSIRAESPAGSGAIFILELAQAGSPVTDGALDAARAAGRKQPQLAASTLLYIEDNLSNFKLVERVLGSQPAIRLIPAMQGGLGIELAERHQPDLILLDLHLPDIPGPTVFERLRTNPRTRDLPVVVVSADATDRQVERLLEAGAADYLTKPLDLVRFLEVIRRHLKVAADLDAADAAAATGASAEPL